ncbi:MAG: hypothetical protein EB127_09505, partial [Alphaproteobacteria bacterium]|nr:hypothetical protein [Alphaproteobacteria bacterium]
MDRIVVLKPNTIQTKAPEKKKVERPVVRTRFGYDARDCVKNLQDVLPQAGPTATGRALHYSADLVCSGGYEIWIRLIWSSVFQNVHLTSLRIFVYLLEKTAILDETIKSLDMEALYKNPEFQYKIAEVVLVVQTLPRKGKLIWPKVPEETHAPTWFQTVPQSRESEAVLKVWNLQNDQPIMRIVGNHILQACEEVNIDKALFWLKWLLDEDKRIRNQGIGYTLTTSKRSGSGSVKTDKAEIGYFIAAILAEAYKDLARRNLVRMHEEFQCLLDLWKGKQSRTTSRQKQECLALMIQIISEVPRWKIPAAQPLIKDPILMSRAVQQSVRFFQEVVQKPSVVSVVPKDIVGVYKKPPKASDKPTSVEDQMRLMDEMVMAFI